MSSLRFEWDKAKSLKNKKKHGISFEEAKSVFYDENALIIADPDHSDEEDRFILLGMSTALRILVVCHCYRGEDETIRIISARQADKREVKSYSKR
ncbi:MAG TPA: BrnT family toxin [Gammaproteobacteria bacterium]